MAARARRAANGSGEVEQRPVENGRPALEIRSSARRTKTASAWWQGSILVMALPARLRGRERERWIEWLLERSLKRRPQRVTSDEELVERARMLVERFDLGVEPTSVRYVSNQTKRWGSCTVATGAIRLTDRLRHAPEWVLDAVLVHELAHLTHPDHSKDFHVLANRYPRQADAALFLEGYQLGLQMGTDAEVDQHDQPEELLDDVVTSPIAPTDGELPLF